MKKKGSPNCIDQEKRNRMSTEFIKIRALRTYQGENEVYSFFIDGRDIFKIADITRISRDDAGELKGFQRKSIQNHISGIVEYLHQKDVLFPNAIILAFDPVVEFKQSRGPVPEGVLQTSEPGVIELPVRPEGQRAAWIVDGQQRSTALFKAQKVDIKVPVIGFRCPDVEMQRQQFVLVNKAKPLPRRLIDELLPEINTPMPSDLSPRRIPSELVNALARTKGSPFFGLIKRPSDSEGDKGVITDTALITVAEASLKNYGALALHKGGATTSANVNEMYEIMSVFWSAVQEVFPEAWGLPPTDSRLMHSAGIEAMGVLMDRIVPRLRKDDEFKKNIKDALMAIKPQCAWTKGEWDGLAMKWNEIQAVTKHKRMLKDHLVQLDYVASRGL